MKTKPALKLWKRNRHPVPRKENQPVTGAKRKPVLSADSLNPKSPRTKKPRGQPANQQAKKLSMHFLIPKPAFPPVAHTKSSPRGAEGADADAPRRNARRAARKVTAPRAMATMMKP